jgi:23S rRNA A1618 N6-methylase RlmF
VVGWLHTDSANEKRDAEITEKKIGQERNRGNPDQELWCDGGKKELPDLLMDIHSLRLRIVILPGYELKPK